MTTLMWPFNSHLEIDLTGFPILMIHVTQYKDQALLHRYLCSFGYVPNLLEEAENSGRELWRFHHPDGEKI